MTFLTGWIHEAKSFFWNRFPEPPKLTLDEIYKENLASFSKSEISLKDCIENCYEAIEETFPLDESDLSERSRLAIGDQLAKFNRAVDETKYLPIDRADKLKIAFQNAFAKVVIRRWTLIMAMSFYPLAAISHKIEQINALEKWTQGFFQGVEYFSGMQGTRISATYVDWLQRKTLLTLDDYSRAVKQQKMEALVHQANKGLIQGKVGKSGEIAGLPRMNQMSPLLMKSVAIGLYLRQKNIVDPLISREHFFSAFNTSKL